MKQRWWFEGCSSADCVQDARTVKNTYSSPTCLRIQKYPDMQGYASKQGDSILPSFLAPDEVRIVKSLVAIWPVAGGRAETPSSLERSHHCSGLSIVAVMRQGLCRLSAEERKKEKRKMTNKGYKDIILYHTSSRTGVESGGREMFPAVACPARLGSIILPIPYRFASGRLAAGHIGCRPQGEREMTVLTADRMLCSSETV